MTSYQRFATAAICACALAACGGGGESPPASDAASQALTKRFVPVQVLDWPAGSEDAITHSSQN